MTAGGEINIIGINGIPEVAAGADLPALIGDAIASSGAGLETGDIVVVTHKIVSKAEGQVVDLTTVEPSVLATQWGERWGKDPRRIEVVLREARRVVRMHNGLIIAETAHGFVCANAGIDLSNVERGYAALLPVDSDRSARRIRDALRFRFGIHVAVIVSDTFGRTWRRGVTDVAIGCAGIAAVIDLRGTSDALGREMQVTEVALADEIASAAELVMGKSTNIPVAVVRGLEAGWFRTSSIADEMIRHPADDLFR